MEIAFETKKLAKILNSEKEIVRTFGAENGRKIMRRLLVLHNAPTLADVPATKPERCHQLKQNLDELFAVYIEHPQRLIFKIAGAIPRKPDGGIELGKVMSIVIHSIEDYHKNG